MIVEKWSFVYAMTHLYKWEACVWWKKKMKITFIWNGKRFVQYWYADKIKERKKRRNDIDAFK